MSGAPCGCCECLRGLTPLDLANRPGLSALRYRAGTHASFLETMLADLSGTGSPSMHGLTTRESNDPSIALLDAWAVVGDVLTFYQERIANEGYLRTATERRSLVELGRLVGYELRPGVAASTHLVYMMDDGAKGEIPAGARSQSIPAPGENAKPQFFETSEALVASSEWNVLRPRASKPYVITLHDSDPIEIVIPASSRIGSDELRFTTALKEGTAFTIQQIQLAGTSTNLKTQDPLLFVFGDGPVDQVLRVVKSVVVDHENSRTIVTLQPVLLRLLAFRMTLVLALQQAMVRTLDSDPLVIMALLIADALRWTHVAGTSASDDDVLEKVAGLAEELVAYANQLGLADPDDPGLLVMELANVANFNTGGNAPNGQLPQHELKDLLDSLLVERSVQPQTSHHLAQDLSAVTSETGEARIQLMQAIHPRLRERYAAAVKSAVLEPESPPLRDLFVLRDVGAPFGFNAPERISITDNVEPIPVAEALVVDKQELVVADADLKRPKQLHLDHVYDRVIPQSWIVLRTPRVAPMNMELERFVERARAIRVLAINTVTRSLYGINAKVSRLALSEPWLLELEGLPSDFRRIRGMSILLQSERLDLAEEPIADNVCGSTIVLDRYCDGLVAGRWVVVAGERSDNPGTKGVVEYEVVMLADVQHRPERGGITHTVLLLAGKGLAYCYRRTTVSIYGNVAPATHGETQEHIIGSGDASQALQSMKLRSAPLTFVSAPTPSGVESTLRVRVNDVLWLESESFIGLEPTSHAFISKSSEDAQTTVVFGNGREGARVPTGRDNVSAKYRVGIGRPGNVGAKRISLLVTKPLGAKSVLNYLPSRGGADPESDSQARANIPTALHALDRLVSVRDYADFSRTFAGIAKATARSLPGGSLPLVHVTIACDADAELDATSELYRNLVAALLRFGDPYQQVRVDMRERLIVLLAAKIRIDPAYLWEKVEPAIRNTLLERFGFERRSLGQPLFASEIVAAIQSVPGVVFVDLDALQSISAKNVIPSWKTNGFTVTTATPPSMSPTDPEKVPARHGKVRAELARYDDKDGTLRPAQLAYLTPEVPATVVLTEIKE